MAKDFTSQRVVDGYDQHIRQLIPGYEVVHQQIKALLKTYMPYKAHLLIVGCGTGYELGYLLQAFPNWQFTAIDVSSTMLDKAKTFIHALGEDQRVNFVLGDINHLNDDVYFDAVLSILVTHFIPFEQKYNFLLATQKKLKQDRIFITFDLTQIITQNEKESLKHLCEINGLTPEQTAVMLKRLDHDFFPLSEERTYQLLRNVGFKDINRFTQILCYQGFIAQ